MELCLDNAGDTARSFPALEGQTSLSNPMPNSLDGRSWRSSAYAVEQRGALAPDPSRLLLPLSEIIKGATR
jgi:hypothetical protein